MKHPKQKIDIRHAERTFSVPVYSGDTLHKRRHQQGVKRTGKRVRNAGAGILAAGAVAVGAIGGAKDAEVQQSKQAEYASQQQGVQKTQEANAVRKAVERNQVAEPTVEQSVAEDLYPVQPEATEGVVAPDQELHANPGGVVPDTEIEMPDSQSGGTLAPSN